MKYKKLIFLSLISICLLLCSCGVIKSQFASKQGEKFSKSISKLDSVKSATSNFSNIDGRVTLYIHVDLKDDSDIYDSMIKIKNICDKNKDYSMSIDVNKENIKFIWKDLYYEKSKSVFNEELLKETIPAIEICVKKYPGKYSVFIGENILDLISIELRGLADKNITKEALFKPNILENTSKYSLTDDHLFVKIFDNKDKVLKILSKIDSNRLATLEVPTLEINHLLNDLPTLKFQYYGDKSIVNKSELVDYIKSIVKDGDDLYIGFQTGLSESIFFLWNSDEAKFILDEKDYDKTKISPDFQELIDLFI